MFLVEKPYISDFLRKTVRDHAIPVVATEIAKSLGLYDGTILISETQAVELLRRQKDLPLYTTSENAIGWLVRHLSFTGLPEKIELFKNKLTFRRLTRSLFPDFYFREVSTEDLDRIPFAEIPLPCIIKPAVGFFSMGVYKVVDHQDWPLTISSIRSEIESVKGLYPQEVLAAGSLIIEQCIEGDEYAVDAYFDADGTPVVAGIFQHTFASETDVSDRVYTTSKMLVEENLEDFTAFAGTIGTLAGVRNFPVHIELRRTPDNILLPIEINPMRFGGWCTTADLTFIAYGLNPYLSFYRQTKPDWPQLLAGKEGKLFSIVILDNSTGKPAEEIASFDYPKLLAAFAKPLELRKIDYTQYPVFGILFTETKEDDMGELANILKSDLNEFIVSNT